MTLDSIRRWLRRNGLAPFGFAQEDFRHHTQVLYVWRPLQRASFEVWRWPVETGTEEKDRALRGTRNGTVACYRRIEQSARLVHSGSNFREAMNAR